MSLKSSFQIAFISGVLLTEINGLIAMGERIAEVIDGLLVREMTASYVRDGISRCRGLI